MIIVIKGNDCAQQIQDGCRTYTHSTFPLCAHSWRLTHMLSIRVRASDVSNRATSGCSSSSSSTKRREEKIGPPPRGEKAAARAEWCHCCRGGPMIYAFRVCSMGDGDYVELWMISLILNAETCFDALPRSRPDFNLPSERLAERFESRGCARCCSPDRELAPRLSLPVYLLCKHD